GVVPGKRIVVAGNGPLNFQLAAELVSAGAQVAAVIEASRPSSRVTSLLDAARSAPALIAKGLAYVARLRRTGVPIHYCRAITAVRGTSRVESCTIAAIDTSGRPDARAAREFEVDTICAGYGFLPANEMARALGCRHAIDPEGRLETIVDADGRTTVDGIYAIGDAAAFRGAHVARCQGLITGCAVARSLGLEIPADLSRELAPARRELARHVSFQSALWRAFAAP